MSLKSFLKTLKAFFDVSQNFLVIFKAFLWSLMSLNGLKTFFYDFRSQNLFSLFNFKIKKKNWLKPVSNSTSLLNNPHHNRNLFPITNHTEESLLRTFRFMNFSYHSRYIGPLLLAHFLSYSTVIKSNILLPTPSHSLAHIRGLACLLSSHFESKKKKLFMTMSSKLITGWLRNIGQLWRLRLKKMKKQTKLSS